MASDGLLNYAKTGKCHICHRVRKTDKHVKAVGEVRHGYATGHIWECIDTEECDRIAQDKINSGHPKSELIKISISHGRIKEYGWRS
jgi:hypothetical protein